CPPRGAAREDAAPAQAIISKPVREPDGDQPPRGRAGQRAQFRLADLLAGGIELMGPDRELMQARHIRWLRRADDDRGGAVLQELLPGSAEGPFLLLPAPPLGIYGAPAAAFGSDHGG